jgi:hypothetical protein
MYCLSFLVIYLLRIFIAEELVYYSTEYVDGVDHSLFDDTTWTFSNASYGDDSIQEKHLLLFPFPFFGSLKTQLFVNPNADIGSFEILCNLGKIKQIISDFSHYAWGGVCCFPSCFVVGGSCDLSTAYRNMIMPGSSDWYPAIDIGTILRSKDTNYFLAADGVSGVFFESTATNFSVLFRNVSNWEPPPGNPARARFTFATTLYPTGVFLLASSFHLSY